MSIQLVVFDIAGTTVKDNQQVSSVLQKTFREQGISIPLESIDLVMGYPKPEAIRLLVEQYEGLTASGNSLYINQLHQYFEQNMIRHYENLTELTEKPHALEVFRELRNNHICVAIDTGFSRSIVNVIFERLNWKTGDTFDASITSDEVERGRPFPDMIYKAMQLCGIDDVEKVAKVGDTASDMQQGKAAGCGLIVGVTTGSYTKAALETEPHTHLIDDLIELLPLLNIPC